MHINLSESISIPHDEDGSRKRNEALRQYLLSLLPQSRNKYVTENHYGGFELFPYERVVLVELLSEVHHNRLECTGTVQIHVVEVDTTHMQQPRREKRKQRQRLNFQNTAAWKHYIYLSTYLLHSLSVAIILSSTRN